MADVKECPMCGVPGSTETKTSKFREWVCPECDYFEEAEED